MSPLEFLKKYFTTGTAESEGNFIKEAFVDVEDFLEIINPPYASPRLLIGRKGSGKSAIAAIMRERLQAAGLPVLLMKPKDIDLSEMSGDHALSELNRIAYEKLLVAIGGKIGSEGRGLAFANNQEVLANVARITGARAPDLVSRLASALTPLGAAISGVNFSEISKHLSGVTPTAVERAVVSNIDKDSKVFYLFIDDTDHAASLDKPGQLNRIWAFMLAARDLTEKCKNIRCIITLRTEVWMRLERDNTGNRDQIDHFRLLTFKLNPSEEHVRKVLEKRLLLASRDAGLDTSESSIYNNFFQGEAVVITGYNETRLWGDYLVKRTRSRPRDVVNFVSRLISEAKSGKINSQHVSSIVSIYSLGLIDDLRAEASYDCPRVKEILLSFGDTQFENGVFEASSLELRNHLRKVTSRFRVILHGVTLAQDADRSAILLWEYLRDAGVLSPKVADFNKRKGYDHLVPEEINDLVSEERWADMQNLVWDVHPAYRDYIGFERSRLGIKRKPPTSAKKSNKNKRKK